MKTRDLRVESIRPLLPPAILLEELPLSEDASQVITRARDEVAEILAGSDDRLIVIVGPCSVHDPAAAGEYARRLKTLSDELAADLRIVMRVHFAKPRTTVGWKGLITDPRLDRSFALTEEPRRARPRLPRDPPWRPERPELRRGQRGQDAGRPSRRRVAGAADDRHQPRQQ